MTLGLWLTFIVTAGTLIAIPGPTNLMVIGAGILTASLKPTNG